MGALPHALAVLTWAQLVALIPRSVSAQTPAGWSQSEPDTGGVVPGSVRIVRFRVSEATWMSLDVAPDGTTMVFDLLGDLYTLSTAGGRAHPLTAGPAFDSQPRFSPDGRQVAFVSDRSGVPNLWVIGRDGQHARQLSNLLSELESPISSPTWSPDGRTIVVSQRFGAVGRMKLSAALVEHRFRWLLAAYDVETGQMRWVSDTAASRARRTLGPVFDLNGASIYAAVEPYRATSSGQTAWHIERVDFASGDIAPEMAPSVGRAGMRPAVSPDGRFLAYASVSGSRLGLRLRDRRTYEERWLVPERLDAPSTWVEGGGGDARDLAPGYAFTPDSKAVIIAFGGRIRRVDIATGRTRVIPFVVEVERELAPFVVHQFSLPDTAVRTRSVLQPALSPDGKAVAFSALNRLWVMDLPDAGLSAGRARRLTSDSMGEFYPSWSPDGTWIAYSVWQDGEGGAVRRVWVRSAASGTPTPSERLTTDTALYFNTAVAPDGERVVAVRAAMAPERLATHSATESTSPPTLVWVGIAGGSPTLITSMVGSISALVDSQLAMNRFPAEQLYFTCESSRIHIGLTSFAWDGTDRRTDLVVADSASDIRTLNDITGVISPDARRALLTHEWILSEIFLPTMPGRHADTLNVEETQHRPFGAVSGASARWGPALAPWISWSRDGRRVLFVQGGTLFVGEVHADDWTSFTRVDVPLMVPVDIPRGTFAFRGGRLITMRGHEVIARGDLVVRDNRIVAVGPTGTVKIPVDARVFDVTGKTILPGYIDIHDHFQYPYGVHPQQCWACLIRLAYGVTALRDPYAPQMFFNDVFAYRERERSGDLVSPRIFSTGIVHSGSDRPIATFEEALSIVRPAAEYFAAETFKEYSDAPWPERRLIAAAATAAGLNATIHGDQLRAIIDGFSGVEHAITVPLYDDVLTLIARSGVTHTQTFGTIVGADGYVLSNGREPWEYQRMRRFAPPSVRRSASVLWREEVSFFGRPEWGYLRPLLQNAAEIVARGGRVGMGMHGNIPGIGFHYEMWFHALGGMPNHEILRSATIVGATAIGHRNDFGSLEAGKLADLQVLDEDPLADIHNTTSIRYVMKNGRLYQADDLTELWPRQRPLASINLWEDSFPPGRVVETGRPVLP